MISVQRVQNCTFSEYVFRNWRGFIMATKSFESEFKFTQKSARALAGALDKSKRVDVIINKPVNFYGASDSKKLKNKFDSIFKSKDLD